MAKTRKQSQPEFLVKPMRRGTLRLCRDCCNRQCIEGRAGLRYRHTPDSWKLHRQHQWREKAGDAMT